MDKLTVANFKSMIDQALADIKARADEFSALDAVCGDGDHGTAIVEALTAIQGSASQGTEFKTMLMDMAMTSMSKSCGSTSTLIGSFFMGMSMSVAGEELDSEQVKAMFKSGLEGVQKNTKAMPGDKTMMDTLVPAVEAFEKDTTDIKELFDAAAEAAAKGAESTIEMKAGFGRARNLGERSIGSADPGATSWACMFNAFASTLN
ncbi:dihydroxyacetone kinase subunit L [Puteibacter caeruleilacunae]|nr:dihydroxyacetone kinase subunit L [Puteibacter caeruleilacunae]